MSDFVFFLFYSYFVILRMLSLSLAFTNAGASAPTLTDLSDSLHKPLRGKKVLSVPFIKLILAKAAEADYPD